MEANLSASNLPGAAHAVVAHGWSNGTIAPSFLVMRCPYGGPLFASSRWPLHAG